MNDIHSRKTCDDADEKNSKKDDSCKYTPVPPHILPKFVQGAFDICEDRRRGISQGFYRPAVFPLAVFLLLAFFSAFFLRGLFTCRSFLFSGWFFCFSGSGFTA